MSNNAIAMHWKIFTRMVAVHDDGIGLRWFWRRPAADARGQSSAGFATRPACEADARQHGYCAAGPLPGVDD
jgi:hypothetical protein